MSGDEESRARAVLAEMQLRISQGPYSALGVTDGDPPEQVRSAFLALTKQFHPARFGRMSSELQRLSNEVFLGIKAAHDQLRKALGASLRPLGPARQTGGMPVVNAEGTARTSAPRSTASIPRPNVSAGTTPPPTQFARGTDRGVASTRPSSPAIGQSGTPASGVPVRGAATADIPTQRGIAPGVRAPTGQVPRQPTPSSGTTPLPRSYGSASTSTSPIPRVTTPTAETQPLERMQPSASSSQALPRATASASSSQAMPRVTTPTTQSQSLQRPSSASSSQAMPRVTTPTAPSQPLQRPSTPGQRPSAPVIPARERSPSQPPPTRLGSPASTVPPRAPADGFNPATVRGVAAAPGGAFDERTAYQDAVALLDAKNWTAARLSLHALAAKVPQSKQYRALLCYARGREAHVAGRAEDALLEYQRALQLDPDLAVVKNAVADLQRRR